MSAGCGHAWHDPACNLPTSGGSKVRGVEGVIRGEREEGCGDVNGGVISRLLEVVHNDVSK